MQPLIDSPLDGQTTEAPCRILRFGSWAWRDRAEGERPTRPYSPLRCRAVHVVNGFKWRMEIQRRVSRYNINRSMRSGRGRAPLSKGLLRYHGARCGRWASSRVRDKGHAGERGGSVASEHARPMRSYPVAVASFPWLIMSSTLRRSSEGRNGFSRMSAPCSRNSGK